MKTEISVESCWAAVNTGSSLRSESSCVCLFETSVDKGVPVHTETLGYFAAHAVSKGSLLKGVNCLVYLCSILSKSGASAH